MLDVPVDLVAPLPSVSRASSDSFESAWRSVGAGLAKLPLAVLSAVASEVQQAFMWLRDAVFGMSLEAALRAPLSVPAADVVSLFARLLFVMWLGIAAVFHAVRCC
jgi:hypothetical protein